MKKKAFTLVEVLIASLIMSYIGLACISQIQLMSNTLYDGQTESTNRSKLNEEVFYITREIQSAEEIEMSDKLLKIREMGHEDFNLEYEIRKDYPTDGLYLNSMKLIDICYEESYFEKDENTVIIHLATVKNSTEPNQIPKVLEIKAVPRKSDAISGGM
ncbi:MAG: prepilin-type N-terminal cleavage/methylation domain-containing protein [Clostridia bacterium]|nr:prepilin-type N-terminal cleavage/methylation domain-containing protein [Clostridia bacterium]